MRKPKLPTGGPLSWPLRVHLLLLVLLLTVPAVAVIVHSGMVQRREALQEASQQTVKLAYSIASEQRDLVTAAEQLLSTLALLPDVRTGNVAATEAILSDLLGKNPHFANILVTDTHGIIRASAVPHKHLVSHAGYRYLTHALTTRRFSSGAYVLGKITGKKVLHFGYPFKDYTGNVAGVIAVALDLEYCRHLLEKSGLPARTSLTLIDHDGIILSRSLNSQFIGSPDKPYLLNTMRTGDKDGTFVAVGLDNTRRLFAYSRLTIAGENEPYLYIRTGIPEEEAVAQANAALVKSLLALAPFPLAGLLLIWGIGRVFIVDRVTAIQNAAQRLAGGELGVRVSGNAGGGELGRLGDAFDEMAEKLSVRETALRESEELFRTLCDAAPIGIFREDSAGNNIYSNRRWEEISGLAASVSRGKGWDRAIHPEDREMVRQEWQKATQTGRPYSCENRYLTPDGRTVWVRVLASPIRGADGAIAGYVGTVEDITELRQAREEMLRIDKLESLGVLAGGIAHDFNNILTAILGNISLAKCYLENTEILVERLEQAENAAGRAKGLTRQLVTFARGGEPVMNIVQLGKVLREAAGFATLGSPVTCEMQLADTLSPVCADEGQMSQVFHNLMLNAVQSMSEGGTITITATDSRSPHTGQRVVKTIIADTGAGIPEEHLPRIFDPYFTTKQQGSGLGLATCHAIIIKHGGTISVDSALDTGSRFTVELPAVALE